jgi:hypothetical protein
MFDHVPPAIWQIKIAIGSGASISLHISKSSYDEVKTAQRRDQAQRVNNALREIGPLKKVFYKTVLCLTFSNHRLKNPIKLSI